MGRLAAEARQVVAQNAAQIRQRACGREISRIKRYRERRFAPSPPISLDLRLTT